jgi:hypothetical protein
LLIALSGNTNGEQAVAAISASLTDGGGPVLRGQLIACRFYEAMERELRHLLPLDPKRSALIAASERCERIAAAIINPTALLDELRKTIAGLRADADASAPPPSVRPVLWLIEGGLYRS